ASADQKLESRREVLYRLDGERLGREPRGEVGDRGSELSSVAQAEHDPARVRLVQESERLEDDRIAELLGRRECILRAHDGPRRAELKTRLGERRSDRGIARV